MSRRQPKENGENGTKVSDEDSDDKYDSEEESQDKVPRKPNNRSRNAKRKRTAAATNSRRKKAAAAAAEVDDAKSNNGDGDQADTKEYPETNGKHDAIPTKEPVHTHNYKAGVVYNLSNDPSVKYSLAHVQDRGSVPIEFTSYKLKTNILYVETRTQRFEIAHSGTTLGLDGVIYDTYRWARVADPASMDRVALEQQTLPLATPAVEIIADNLDWADFQWGVASVHVNSSGYPIKRLFWVAKH